MKKLLYFIFIIAFFTLSCENTQNNLQNHENCPLNDNSFIKDGDFKILYDKESVKYGEKCNFNVRICKNGQLSGEDKYIFENCEIQPPKSCNLENNLTLIHNTSRIFYKNETVAFGKECEYEIRTCINGNLSGNSQYKKLTCTIKQPTSCYIDDLEIKHGEGRFLYSTQTVSYNDACNNYKQFRICNNGTLSGNNSFKFKNCIKNKIPEEEAEFITRLNPEDTHTATDNSGNVLQGITAFGKDWFVSQDAGNGYILFNHLDENGNHIEDWQISEDSHGQDLSWNFEDNKITLYTVSAEDNGISKYQITWNPVTITKKSTIKLFDERTHITPTLNTEKNKLAVRAVKTNDPSDSRIFLYTLESINSSSPAPYYDFPISNEQTGNGQYFQGIVFYKDKYIYCLTGNNKSDGEKKLYKYSAYNGELLAKYTVTAGFEEAVNDDEDGNIHYEPEGLAYKDGYLYFTIISGEKSRRIKRLYRIKRF